MADKIEALAKECGATFYTHRSSPHAPAVAFGPDAWASFCARALAQGEPGEATPAPPPCATCNGEGGWERANSSTSYSWQKCPHCHLSLTASAPAAEREPLTPIKCIPPSDMTSINWRLAYRQGWWDAENAHGIGTKEPTNG